MGVPYFGVLRRILIFGFSYMGLTIQIQAVLWVGPCLNQVPGRTLGIEEVQGAVWGFRV